MQTSVNAKDLARAQLFGVMPEDIRGDIAARATMRDYDANAIIFHEGDEGASLFLVVNGSVDIIDGDDLEGPTLSTLGAGTVFGELAVFNAAPRSATARAGENCRLAEITGEDVKAVVASDADLAVRMMGAIASVLTSAKEEVTHINHFLDERVKERTREVRETQLEVIRRLGRAAEYKDEATGAHIYRMSNYSAALARAAGFEPAAAELLLNAAPMHDVGKIGVPDRILQKPGKLDEDEWIVMRAHTTMGANMLQGSNSDVIKLAAEIALTHHERWDGAGYPNGIKTDAIPIEARICCIADVFDALTSERPYKKAWTFEDALIEINDQREKMFDPELVDLFQSLHEDLVSIRDTSLSIVADEVPLL